MRRLLVAVVVLVLPGSARADEADDAFARRLGGMVRDFRLTTAARAEAARTLGKLGPRSAVAVPDLIAVFGRLRGTEQEPLQEAIVEALGLIGGPARPALLTLPRGTGRTADVDLAIRRATELILNAPPSLEVDLLVEQLRSRDPSTRVRATKALADYGPAAGRGVIPGLLAAMGDTDGDVRRGAVAAFRIIQPDAPPPEVMVRAIAVDLRSSDPNLRLLAARALGRIGPLAAGAAPDLDLLRGDPDPDVRRAASEAFPRVNVPPPAPPP
jgi:HEAT repeat protein